MIRVHDKLTLTVLAANDPTLLVFRKSFDWRGVMHIQCAITRSGSWLFSNKAQVAYAPRGNRGKRGGKCSTCRTCLATPPPTVIPVRD